MKTKKRKQHMAFRLSLIIFALILSADPMLLAAPESAWITPIGIPEPPFGIEETHWMYENQTYDFGNGPEPYRMGPDGPYTHYVDNTHPQATNESNPFGTHDKPRMSYSVDMRNLRPGSVVELHGGPYGGIGELKGSGTLEKPIFIRGTPEDKPVVFCTVWWVNGDYYIIENFEFDRNQERTSKFILYGDGISARTHLAVRNCEFHRTEVVPYNGNTLIGLRNRNADGKKLENIVIYNNHFHHCGEGRTRPVKGDVTAVGIGQNVENVWILDNLIHHIGGDGIQPATDNPTENAIIPNHIYIGRNIFHDNFENAVDLKKCQDVIISQNTAYNFGEAYGENSHSPPFRYGGGEGGIHPGGRKNVWTIFNEVYHCDSADGAFLSYSVENSTEPFADEIYYIGNIVHDCHNAEGKAAAFGCWNQQNIYFANNLVYDCDGGGGFWLITGEPNENLTLINNIFAESGTNIRGYLNIGTKTQGPSDFANLTMSNNLFFQRRGPGKLSFYQWNSERERLEYTAYTIEEFKKAKPDKSVGTIEADPLFVVAGNNNFHLQSNSPAIDGGTVHDYFDRFYNLYGVKIDMDFEGNPYPQGTAPDIGAYESGAASLKYDVNMDSAVNIQDLQACVNHVLGKQDWGYKSDVNRDGKVDNWDMTEILNAILKQ